MFDAGQQPVLYGDVEEKYSNLLAGRETLQTTTKKFNFIFYLLNENFKISCLRRLLPHVGNVYRPRLSGLWQSRASSSSSSNQKPAQVGGKTGFPINQRQRLCR
jgi:hypothetical protein